MENDELKILIEAALDLEKSLSTMTAQMNQLREKFKDYQIRITAGLNQTASAAQIKRDLTKINKVAKNRVQLTGEMDRDKTQKNVNSTLKKLKDAEVKITGVLDSAATTSNIQSSLGSVHDITAKANIEVEGAERVDDLRKKMDKAGNSAAGMAAQVYLARTALTALRTAAREAIGTMTELDSAVTDLSMATGQSREQTYDLLQDYNKLAGQLGATTTQVAQAADQWLRQGHSISDTTTLIQDAMILSKVSQLDAATATSHLISAMKGYKIAAQDVIGIVDKLSAVDLESATDAGGLAEAMSRTAVTADMAGVSMDRLLGYLATVGEVTQKSMSSVGESFKTIFTRMSDIKANKLELIDEDGTVETLSDVELTLKNVGIDLRKTVNEYANYGDVLDNLAAKWNTLSKVQQNALAKAFSGVRQGENFRVLMENYASAMKYMDIAADSAGTATEKFSLYVDSIEARTAAFTAAVESLTLDTIDSELVKDLIDAGTAIVELVEKAGLLKATLLSLGAGAVMKGVQTIATGFKNVSQNILDLGESINILRRVGDTSNLAGETISKLGFLTKGLSDEQLKLVLTSRQLSSAQMQAILMASGLTAEEAAQRFKTLGLAASQETAAGATWSLSAAMQGLGASIKAAMVANPIGTVMMAISAATVVVSLFSNALEETKQKAEEARQEAIEAANAASSLSNEVIDLTSRYLELSEAVKTDTSVKEDLLSVQNDLIDKLRIEQNRVRELTEEYGSLTDAMKAAALEKLKEAERDIRGGQNAHTEELFMAGNESVSVARGSTDKTVYDEMRRALNVLKDAGLLDSSNHYVHEDGYAMYFGINAGAGEDLDTVEGMLNAYEKLGKMLDVISDEMGSDNVVYKAIYDAYNGMSDAADNYRSSISQLNDNLAQQYMLHGLIGKEIPSTQEAFDQYRQGVIDEAIADGKFVGANQDVIDSIDGVLKKQSEFATFYADELANTSGQIGTYKAKLEELPEVLSELRSAYDLIEAAQDDMTDGGGLSPETIEKLAKAEENYLDYLYEENGVVKLNTEAWKENANAKMLGEIDEIRKEIDSLKERNAELQKTLDYYNEYGANGGYISAGSSVAKTMADITNEIKKNNAAIEENQSKIAIYENLFGSITGVAGQLKSTLNVFDGYTSSMEKLADLQDLVANGYTVEADKVRELVEVYPKILEAATKTATGEIQLSKDVVNAVLADERDKLNGTIDAEIGKLTAKRELLQTELNILNEQVAAAESADEATVASANEAASAKMAIEQAVLSACEQAGIDEKTANEMALAAMTGEWDTFSTLAQQAMYDLDDESATAFTSVMNNFATMSRSVVNNTNEIIGAYSQMGDALSRAMQGLTTGQYNASISGGSVSGSGRKAAENLLADMFEAAKSDYGNGGTMLDDQMDVWKQRLQDIADSYTNTGSNLDDLIKKQASLSNQIASVNGQIQLLESLKNKPLDSFKSGGSSSKSGSSSSKKEIEEYIATLEDYREALERLAKARETVAEVQRKISDSDDLKEQLILERELIDAYEREQAALHNLKNQRDSTITAGAQALRELGFEVSYNADTNELWIANMEHLNELVADDKGKYDSLQEATNALRKETEDLIDSLTDLNDVNKDGSEEWWKLRSSIIEAHEQIQSLLKDIVDRASKAVDSMQNVYDALHQAADEYAETGCILVDTIQKIKDLGVEYLSYLRAEDGQLVINEERLRDIIAAKTEEMAIESAMSYVTALRIAQESEDVETLNRLLYATEQATSATWGLVYANLQLLGLNDDQYQAALHNINALRALTESAIQSIGKVGTSVKDELNSMKGGLDDILKYVMDMLKQRINDQIDAIEDMKDAYSETIDQRKEALRLAKEENSYQKSLASKMKELAKLQARIDSLGLAAEQGDRKAMAERASLMEEMEKLQEDLADTQADYTLDAQKEALDKMEDAYHKEKDQEIKVLEDSISSYQKLYDMAIEYIESHWDTLYRELIDWNTQYGNDLNSDITTAWENCLAAAQRYGSYVSALNSIGADISAAGMSGQNLQVGNTYYSDKASNAEMVSAIVSRMKGYAAQWSSNNTKALNDSLHEKAVMEASQLDRYGVHAQYDGSTGVWTITRDDNDPSKVGKNLYSVYHEGTAGAGGVSTLKQDEVFAILQKGEMVLPQKTVDDLCTRIENMKIMTEAVAETPDYLSKFSIAEMFKLNGAGTVNNVTNNSNSRSGDIVFGDTIINGAAPDAIPQHIKVTEDMMNQIAKWLGLKM